MKKCDMTFNTYSALLCLGVASFFESLLLVAGGVFARRVDLIVVGVLCAVMLPLIARDGMKG